VIFVFFPNVDNKFRGEFIACFPYFEEIKVACDITLLSECLCAPLIFSVYVLYMLRFGVVTTVTV
jgi:hypothetical protein